MAISEQYKKKICLQQIIEYINIRSPHDDVHIKDFNLRDFQIWVCRGIDPDDEVDEEGGENIKEQWRYRKYKMKPL